MFAQRRFPVYVCMFFPRIRLHAAPCSLPCVGEAGAEVTSRSSPRGGRGSSAARFPGLLVSLALGPLSFRVGITSSLPFGSVFQQRLSALSPGAHRACATPLTSRFTGTLVRRAQRGSRRMSSYDEFGLVTSCAVTAGCRAGSAAGGRVVQDDLCSAPPFRSPGGLRESGPDPGEGRL